jgi:hypothetical protein
VWSERTAIIVIYCYLLVFSDCNILFCYRNTSQYVAMLVWSESTTPYNYCCCLLIFSDSSIIFVTVIIYGSSYLPKFAKTILPPQYFARCRSVGVIWKNNNNSNILLFATFFLIVVFFLLPLSYTVHCICLNSQNYIATAILRKMSQCWCDQK